MSKLKPVLFLSNSFVFGAVVQLIFVPVIAPQITGTLLSWIVSIGAGLGYGLFLMLAMSFRLHSLIIILNAAWIAGVFVVFILSVFAPAIASTFGAIILAVIFGYSIFLYILLKILGGESSD